MKEEVNCFRDKEWFNNLFCVVEVKAGKFGPKQKKEINEAKKWIRENVKGRDCFGSMYYHQGHLSGLLVASKKVVDRLRREAPLGQITFDPIKPPNVEVEKIFDPIGGALEQRWCKFSSDITGPDNYTFMI
jgi:hypothetical protein